MRKWVALPSLVVAVLPAAEATEFTLKCNVLTDSAVVNHSNGQSKKGSRLKEEWTLTFVLNAGSGRFYNFDTAEWTNLSVVSPVQLEWRRGSDCSISIDRRNGKIHGTCLTSSGAITVAHAADGSCVKIAYRTPAQPKTAF